MKHETLEGLIDVSNSGQMKYLIFRTRLTDTVESARVWLKDPVAYTNESASEFFFIKNEAGIYVAAVLDMYSDLHVLVKTEHRKQGILSRAMIDVILPKRCISVGERHRKSVSKIHQWPLTLNRDGDSRSLESYSAERDLLEFSEC